MGAVASVLDLAKAFERVSLPVVFAWATHFSFPRKILRVLGGYFEHQRRVQFEGCAAEPLKTIGRVVLQDALSEVTKIYPSLKLRVFVDDITALFMGKKHGRPKEVLKRLRGEVSRKGLKLSVNERGTQGKSWRLASCSFLEEELLQCSMEGGVTMADSVETNAWCGPENKGQEVGCKRKSEEEEVQVEILDH